MKRPVTLLLVGVLVAQLAAIAALLALRPTRWEAPPPSLPNPDSLQTLALASPLPERARYAVQVQRPLFVPGRRPVVEAASIVEETADSDVLEKVQLLGVYGASGEEGGVILRYDGELKRVAVGKRLDALTLARVDGMNAVFWDGKKEHVLRLAPIPRAAPVQRPQSRLQPGAAPRAPHEQTQTEAQQPAGADETVQADLPAPEGATQLPVPVIRR